MKNLEESRLQEYLAKLKPGIKGEMAINAGIYKGRYATRVEDFKGEWIGFAHPFMKGALLPVYRDMDFSFTMEDGGALFIFDFSVRRSEPQRGLQILWASMYGEPRRIQRRQFLRVPCLWDISIFHMETEQQSPMSVKWIPAKAIDVSLGGARFRLPDEQAEGLRFENGDKIFTRFSLSGITYYQMSRTSRVTHENRVWEVGIIFDQLPANVERKLFEYIRQQEIIGRDQK